MSNEKQCKNCEFFFQADCHKQHKSKLGGECGECRVYPPEVFENNPYGSFPIVREDNWCGYFIRRYECYAIRTVRGTDKENRTSGEGTPQDAG